jgi:hypothetical protein
MTMVVARYNEDLDWLRTVPWNYIVYNKGGILPDWIKNEIKLPNIGHEAHTYLVYIIDNYDNLPDYTIFVQGYPFDHSKKLIEKINNFDAKDDFFALSDAVLQSDATGYPWHPGLKIGESAQKLFLDQIDVFEFLAGAEFIVSKRAILFHSMTTYQRILDFLIGSKDIIEPFSGWVMERLWKTIFDCKHKTLYDEE